MFSKKRIIIVLILIISILGGYYGWKYYKSRTKTTKGNNFTYELVSPVVQNLQDEVSMYGDSKIKDEQKLSFSQSGKITNVNVVVGQRVKKGDTLASIETTTVQNTIKDARRSLEDAQIRLKEINDPTKWNIELEKMQQDIEKTKGDIKKRNSDKPVFIEKKQLEKSNIQIGADSVAVDLAIAEKEYKKQILDLKNTTLEDKIKENALLAEPDEKALEISKKEKDIQTMQLDYNEKMKNPDAFINKKVDEFRIALSSDFIDMKKFVDDLTANLRVANEVLNFHQTYDNFKPTISQYFSAKMSLYKSNASAAALTLQGKVYNLQEKIKKTDQNNLSINDIIDLYEVKKSMMPEIIRLGENLTKAAENSIESEGVVSMSDFNSYAALGDALKTLGSDRGITEDKKINEYKLVSSIENLKSKAKLELENEKQNIEDGKNELEKLKKNYAAKLGIAGNALQGQQIDQAYRDLEAKKLFLQYQEKIAGIKQGALENKQKIIAIDKEIADYDRETREMELALKEKKVDYNTKKQKGNSLEVRSAQSAVEAAQSALSNAEKELENYVIKAPFDGEIKTVEMRVGDAVGGVSSAQGNQFFITIQNPDLVEVAISVPQKLISKIALGNKAEVVFDAFPQKKLEASVTQIAISERARGEGNFIGGASSAVNYDVKVTLEKKGLNIVTGMTAKVSIIGESVKNALTIPYTAAELQPEGYYTVEKSVNGKIVKTQIETGLITTKFIEVKKGLTKQDKIRQVGFDSSDFKLPERDLMGEVGGY